MTVDSITQFDELHIVQGELAQARALLKERDAKIADLVHQQRWLQGLLRNRNMSKSDCILASVMVENHPAILKGEEVKIDVRNLARKAGYSDSAATRFFSAMKESEALNYICEHTVDKNGTPTSASTVQANIAFMLAPNRINTKATPTRSLENGKAIARQKVRMCPNCGGNHLKSQCQECFAVIEEANVLDVPEEDAARVKENILVRRFIKNFTSHDGHTLRINEHGQVVIGVPATVDDREFEMYEQFTNEHEITVRKMLEGKSN